MYPYYVIVRRTRRALGVEYHVVGIYDDIIQAFLEANRRNHDEEAFGDKTTFVVNGLPADELDGANRRMRNMERMGCDLYSSERIRDSASEIRRALRE